MMSGERGAFGSKQVVKCGYCDETSRKDNLARHIETKHPGESFKFSYIECSEREGINNYFIMSTQKVSENKQTGSFEENSNINEEETDLLDEIEAVEEHPEAANDLNMKSKRDSSDDKLGPDTKKTNVILEWQ